MRSRTWFIAPVLLVVCAAGLWAARGGTKSPARAVNQDEAQGAKLAVPVVEIVSPPLPAKHGPSKEQKCASGCSMQKHPVPPFTEEDFQRTLKTFARQTLPSSPADASSAAERLLFYGRRTQELLKTLGSKPLPGGHRRWLAEQLAHTHALVALRIVDDQGRTRAELPWTRAPFGIKQHLHPQTFDIQSMEFNGTVMRTGLGHIWARY